MKSVKEMVKMYFALLSVIVSFFAIFGEFGKQIYLMSVTPSEKWEKIQDSKLSDERRAGLEAEKDMSQVPFVLVF